MLEMRSWPRGACAITATRERPRGSPPARALVRSTIHASVPTGRRGAWRRRATPIDCYRALRRNILVATA